MAAKDLDGYLVAMDAHRTALVEEGIAAIAFGDLSVSGALALKERQLSPLGLEIVEPLWGLTSDEVMSGLLGSVITARCVVVDADHLPREALGRTIDAAFLADLAAGVDPAGELGEYHSFVADGSFFDAPIPLETGEPVLIESVVGTTEGPAPTGGGPFRPGSAESQSRQRAVDDRAGRQVVLLIEVLHRAGLTERVDAERHGGHTER